MREVMGVVGVSHGVSICLPWCKMCCERSCLLWERGMGMVSQTSSWRGFHVWENRRMVCT